MSEEQASGLCSFKRTVYFLPLTSTVWASSSLPRPSMNVTPACASTSEIPQISSKSAMQNTLRIPQACHACDARTPETWYTQSCLEELLQADRYCASLADIRLSQRVLGCCGHRQHQIPALASLHRSAVFRTLQSQKTRDIPGDRGVRLGTRLLKHLVVHAVEALQLLVLLLHEHRPVNGDVLRRSPPVDDEIATGAISLHHQQGTFQAE